MRTFDEATYREFAEALGERVAAHAPDWTDHNDSDPGITLIELFAFVAESLLYRQSMIPERGRATAARLAQSALALATARRNGERRPRATTLLSPANCSASTTSRRSRIISARRLRRLNRALHGSGIVRGLAVSVEGDGPEQRVVVEPGFALAPTGEEIEVPGRRDGLPAASRTAPARRSFCMPSGPPIRQPVPDGQGVQFSADRGRIRHRA